MYLVQIINFLKEIFNHIVRKTVVISRPKTHRSRVPSNREQKKPRLLENTYNKFLDLLLNICLWYIIDAVYYLKHTL